MKVIVWALVVGAALGLFAPATASAQVCERTQTLRAELQQSFFERRWNGFPRANELAGCEAEVADILAAFRAENADEIADDGRSPDAAYNRFQLLAIEADYAARANQIARALALLEAARAEPQSHRPRIPNSILDAQSAFLRRDQAGLLSARELLLRDTQAAAFDDNELGPLFADALVQEADSYVRCFERSYAEARSAACSGMRRAP